MPLSELFLFIYKFRSKYVLLESEGKLRKPLRRPDGRRKGLFTHLYYATPYFVHAAATAAVQISAADASPAATTSLTSFGPTSTGVTAT